MTGTVQAGLAVIGLVWVGAGFLIRWACTGGQPSRHRGARRPRRIEVYVPGHHLIPALAYGAAVPQDIAHCAGCRRSVPVTVHGDAHRCERGHITIHSITGEAA